MARGSPRRRCRLSVSKQTARFKPFASTEAFTPQWCAELLVRRGSTMRKPRSLVLCRHCSARCSRTALLTGCVIPSPSPGTAASLTRSPRSARQTLGLSAFSMTALDTRADGTLERSELARSLPSAADRQDPDRDHGRERLHNVWAVSELRTLHFGGLGWRSCPTRPASRCTKSPMHRTDRSTASAPTARSRLPVVDDGRRLAPGIGCSEVHVTAGMQSLRDPRRTSRW